MDFVWLIYCLGVFFGSRLILGATGRSFWIQYLPWLNLPCKLKNFIVETSKRRLRAGILKTCNARIQNVSTNLYVQ